MPIKPLLRRLAVIGRDNEHRIGAERLGFRRQLDRRLGTVGAGSGDNGDLPLGDLDAALDHHCPLGTRQRRRLAGGTASDDAGDAVAYLAFDQRHQTDDIDLAVAKRCDERRDRPVEAQRVHVHGNILQVGNWPRSVAAMAS